MAKLTKNRKESLTKFETEKLYSLKEASDVVKNFSKLKFDSSIDLAVNLGVDPKKADQNVRGIVSLASQIIKIQDCYFHNLKNIMNSLELFFLTKK